MKSILAITFATLVPFSSFAEPILTCQTSDGKTKLETVDRSQYPSLPENTVMVKFVRPGTYDRYTRVHPLTLQKNALMINDSDYGTRRENFRLTLGKFNSDNQYNKAKLVYKIDAHLGSDDRMTKPETLKFDLSCSVSGIEFENVCSAEDDSVYNNDLLVAVATGNIDKVEQALACGADVNTKDEMGCSALMLSALTSKNDCSVTNVLQRRRTETLLWDKAAFIFEYLLDEGADTSIIDKKGETVTHKVVQQGMANLVPLLKKAGANLNGQAEFGLTPIMQATKIGYWKGIQELVQAEADVTKKNVLGQTAYDMGEHLPKEIRNLLVPSDSLGLVILGQANGCSPKSIKIPMSKPTKITLKSTTSDMFLMESKDLGINLMAAPGGTASQIINTSKMGTFKFQCGVHGGAMTTGEIEVTM
jgi:hypothetical protein